MITILGTVICVQQLFLVKSLLFWSKIIWKKNMFCSYMQPSYLCALFHLGRERNERKKIPSVSLFYNINKVKEIMQMIHILMTENILLIIQTVWVFLPHRIDAWSYHASNKQYVSVKSIYTNNCIER